MEKIACSWITNYILQLLSDIVGERQRNKNATLQLMKTVSEGEIHYRTQMATEKLPGECLRH